jgi:hypothetical protein
VDYTPLFTFANINKKHMLMNRKIGSVFVLVAAFLTATTCNSQTAGCCGGDKSKTSCSKNCSTKKESKKMETEKATCSKCGKNSCDTNCEASKTENTSIGGITDDVCADKSIKQIEREAEAFKKMNAYQKISAVIELETGYEFLYENVNQAFQLELADFLKLEVKCCPTYTYAMIVDTQNKKVKYQRFGSAQIKAELKEYLELVGLLKK